LILPSALSITSGGTGLTSFTSGEWCMRLVQVL